MYLKVSFTEKCAKILQKHAKTCISSTNLSKESAKTSKNVQNCAKNASQIFLNPIQKCVSSRLVLLESVLLKALLYVVPGFSK